jgi:hypothetical protein
MVGLLCEDEPFPPETIQHYAAYLGIVETIDTELALEMDDIYSKEVGEDLLPDEQERQAMAELYRSTRRTPEEIEERKLSKDLIARQVEKNKKKLERQDAPAEEFKAPEAETPSLADTVECWELRCMVSALFAGPPATPESRQIHRPLEEHEKGVFKWRMLCDDAFQEDHNLRHADFNWKCYRENKWFEGLTMLMIFNYGANMSRTERALHKNIGEQDYVDKASWPRVREVERIVKELRASYDPHWNPELAAVDQRHIYALCATELHHNADHCKWARAFVTNCEKRGIQFTSPGNYQTRLEIYRRMEPSYQHGLSTPYYSYNSIRGFQSAKTPADFEKEDVVFKTCHNGMCCMGTEDNLKLCARCKVVRYCSRECQAKDWPDHKKHCKEMATIRKDKEKMSEICKVLYET